jgi:hypothetical protein
MTTYNITINEQVPQGKVLIALLKNMDGVVLKKVKPLRKKESPYNPEFVAKVKRAMSQKGRIIDPKNIWDNIG